MCDPFLQLVNNYGTNPNIRAAVDKFDFYIVPVANPDGYFRSWDTTIAEVKVFKLFDLIFGGYD